MHPALLGEVFGRVAVAVEAGAEGGVGVAADGTRDEDFVTPDDRARMREAGERRAPEDVLTLRAVPAVGEVLPVGHARRLTPAERRPVAGGSFRSFARRGRAREGRPHDAPHRPELHLGRGNPCAAVEYHPPRRASVRDEVEADAAAVRAHPVTPRPFAALRRFGSQKKFDLLAFDLPAAGERRPAVALQLERTGGVEPRGEDPELQGRGRDSPARLPAGEHDVRREQHSRGQSQREAETFAARSFHLQPS